MEYFKHWARILLALPFFIGALMVTGVVLMNYGGMLIQMIEVISNDNPIIEILLASIGLIGLLKILINQREIIATTLNGCMRVARTVI